MCMVSDCDNEPDLGICSECWAHVPKEWRRWYMKDQTMPRLGWLIIKCFEAIPRWSRFSEETREEITQMAMRAVRRRWEHPTMDLAQARRIVMKAAHDGEHWEVQPAHGRQGGPVHVRLFLMRPDRSSVSAYAHRPKELRGVMEHLRGR